MKKILLVAAAAMLLAAPARADYVIKDGNGVTRFVKSQGDGSSSGSPLVSISAPSDSTGAPYSAANPLAIKFGTGVTLPAFAAVPSFDLRNINGAVPSASNPLWVAPANGATFPISGAVSFTAPQHVICDSGCSAGGGGLSVPFSGAIGANGTPVGFKDGSGNFQPLLGDVTNGQWVAIKSSVSLAVTGTFWQATQPVSIASMPTTPVTGTFWPYTLGQQVAGSSVPVVLPTAQITALTPPTTVAVTQPTAANLNATVVGTGTFAVQAAATQSGTWTVQPGNTANTTPWLASISQGGNSAAVKAASTAPVATDPALVVTLSPNSVSSSIVKTARPSYSNNTQNPLTTGTDGGLVLTDGLVIGPATASGTGAVPGTTFNTWGYEYVRVSNSANENNWKLECSDPVGSKWYDQNMTAANRFLSVTETFGNDNAFDARLSGYQCRLNVTGFSNASAFTLVLRKTGSEPISMVHVGNQVQTFIGKGSTDPNAGWVPSGSYYSSTALEAKHVVKSASGNATQICAWSSAGALLQVFNSTTVPADGAVTPIAVAPITANGKSCVPDSPGGMAPMGFTTGLALACSSVTTNPFTKTEAATCMFEVRFQ